MAEKQRSPVLLPGSLESTDAEGVTVDDGVANESVEEPDSPKFHSTSEPGLPGSCMEANIGSSPSRLGHADSWASKRPSTSESQRSSGSASRHKGNERAKTRTATAAQVPRVGLKATRSLTTKLDELRNRLDISAEEESVGGLDPWRATVNRFLSHRYVQMAVASVILLNTVYVGIETDEGNPWATSGGVDGVEIVFVVIFTIEIALRLFVGLRHFFCGALYEVCWNVFDLGLVVIALTDLLFLSLFFQGAAEDLEGFGVLRILRVLRVARVLRLLQFFEELWLLVAGVLDAMRSLVWAWVLICLIIYIFSILITSTVGKMHARVICQSTGDEVGVLFGSVTTTMFTLFSVMTINGWGERAKCAMEVEPWAWVMFVAFLVCTSYGMLNVIIAVIVEGTLERAMQRQRLQSTQEDAERRQHITQVVGIFHKSDKDKNGMVTREEFLTSLEQPAVMKNMLSIGIDVAKARNLFDILDYDCSGSLDLTEFLHGMLRARGEAASKDIIQLQCDVMRAEQRQREALEDVRDRFIRRLKPVEMEIEAAHLEVKRLICALEASAQNASLQSCGAGGSRGDSEDTMLLSCSSMDGGYTVEPGLPRGLPDG